MIILERVDSVIKNANNKLSPAFKTAFISALAVGIFAHIYMFTNKLPNFDDLIGIDNFGVTFKNGRWFLWVVGAIAYHLDLVFSLPWINGMITLGLLGISSGMTADLLDIRSKTANALLGAAFVVFPSWTGTFFYMFTAPYYALAVLMSVASVFLMVRYQKGIFVSPILLACSLGIYQSYLPFTATLYVVLLFLMLFDAQYGYLDILKRSLLYLFNMAVGTAAYFICIKLSLLLTGQQLNSYKGISTMGKFELARIPEIFRTIAVNFFGIFLNNNMEISYSYIIKGMYLVLYVASFGMVLYLFAVHIRKRDVLKAVETVVLFGVYIIAINSIYIMCEDGIYSLMYFSYVFLMIFPLALLDRCIRMEEKKVWFCTEYVITIVTAIGVAVYCHFANGEYLSMQLSYEQASSYYNTMITQIKSVDGYQDDMKVVFSGSDIVDKTLYHNEVMDIFSMSGRDDALADAYSKQNFIRYYCGFDAEIADISSLTKESHAKIAQMPLYPNAGSIQVMDNAVVVKLSD
ncbi:hypothetical protein FMM75_16535 [Lachnospiraceae bacterium MD335]|nr:hypothetical protein [Lachnospiraceae bacterium MD335]